MNSQKPVIFEAKTNAGVMQDKDGEPRLSAASSQPSTAAITALKTNGNADHSSKQQHSTKRRKVFAGAWIDVDTDAYIHFRQSRNKNLTRSGVIADMLKERAQDDIFERNQKILLPIIQETMRAEFRIFTTMFVNRFLALIARIAYQVSYILNLLINFLTIFPGINATMLHKIDTDSENAARVHITQRTPQIDEVISRLKQEMEDKHSWQS
jgi:hypothetical protein